MEQFTSMKENTVEVRSLSDHSTKKVWKKTYEQRICFETTSDSEAIIMHLAYIRSARKLLWSEKHLYYLVIIAKLFIKYHDFLTESLSAVITSGGAYAKRIHS